VTTAGEWYLREALAQIPRILTLQDRDPSSPSYGCFDRNYWHYRTQDFPSGMYQELALPLAQVFTYDLPGNRWYREPRVRELALAGVRCAAHQAHPDGSCDDYFPYERALGATAFAAAAHAEVLRLLDAHDADLVEFCRRRAQWLVERQESGRLSNHQALVALAAARASDVTGDEGLREAARDRLGVCLSWQHAEGWFAEYEGADPGYQSLTIAFLAGLRAHFDDAALEDALARAVRFAAHFLHPDGSYGGEIGSRNTCQVLPSGWERLAHHLPEARYLADGWLAGAIAGRRGYADDDRIFCHWVHDFIEAARSRGAREATAAGGAPSWSPPPGRTSFPGAQLHVVREGDLHLVVATSKGGVFRAYRGQHLLANDTGPVVLLDDGQRLVSHMVDAASACRWEERAVEIAGNLHRGRRRLPTPVKQVIFRLLNLGIGRIAPDLLRRLLQRLLITGKEPQPVRFQRRLDWSDAPALEVVDSLEAASGIRDRVARLLLSTDATTIYVATSNLWQDASRLVWEERPGDARDLRERGRCEFRRRLA
jgi:hypothetical protein